MLVESFEALEVLSTHSDEDCTQAINNLVTELGLTGQMAADTDKPICTFRDATRDEINVYRILMPTKVKLKDYKAGPIPLRILELCKKAKEQGLEKLFVWYPLSGPKDDPIVFAHNNQHDFQLQNLKIIGRWGDCLEAFDVLKAKALKIAKMKLTAALTHIKMKATMDLKSMDVLDEDKVLEQMENIPGAHWNL